MGSSGLYLLGVIVWEAHHDGNVFQIKRLQGKMQS